MPIIHLRARSMHEVEDILARVWCALEAYGLDSPALDMRLSRTGTVDVLLHFDTLPTVKRVIHCLEASLARRRGKYSASCRRTWKRVATVPFRSVGEGVSPALDARLKVAQANKGRKRTCDASATRAATLVGVDTGGPAHSPSSEQNKRGSWKCSTM
jgi:hypothetical protein